ncbi:restriction endonuclease subunit S [Acinetobacter indicus]|uniref:restriction endonuclease subunit S n=1 Tax=Acinetobacter indicus TaxID=756892 RepID=UPI0012E17BB8|nr:restriction endonuclease subunit S [Acinetobacter indicus]
MSSISTKNLPVGWSVAYVEEIADIKSGKRLPKGIGLTESDNGYPYIRVADMANGTVDLNNIMFVPREVVKFIKKYIITTNDIYISVAGTLGLVGIIPNELNNANLTENANRLTNLKCNKLFLLYSLQTENIKRTIQSVQTLGAQPKLAIERIKKFEIILPPTVEQQKIAQALTDADNYISALEKLIEKKKMIKEGLMVNLLTGKQRLKEFAFNEDGTAKSYKDSELGKIPEDWEVIELIDTASKSKKWSFVGGPFGSSLKTDDYTEYGIQIIQLQNMGDGHFINDNVIYTSVEKANELLSNNIYAGEIIISKMGDPVARACIMPNHADRYLMASDGIRLSIDTNKFDTRFIHDFINFKIFRKQAINASTGSTRQRISLSELKKLKLFSPSYEEQLAIGNTFRDLDSQILALDQKLNKAKLLKQGMMQKLLTGEIRLA